MKIRFLERLTWSDEIRSCVVPIGAIFEAKRSFYDSSYLDFYLPGYGRAITSASSVRELSPLEELALALEE